MSTLTKQELLFLLLALPDDFADLRPKAQLEICEIFREQHKPPLQKILTEIKQKLAILHKSVSQPVKNYNADE